MAESIRTYKQRLEEFATLYEKYPRKLIQDKLNITEYTYNKMLKHCVMLNIEQMEKRRDLLSELERNVPFSTNEDDYGSNVFEKKTMITREGILEFKGNNPLKNAWTELSAIAQHYKETMNFNNIILPKISHENFYKYEQQY